MEQNTIKSTEITSSEITTNLTNYENDLKMSIGNMKVSDKGLKFIADYEKFSAMPYRGADSQNLTVGYGHVIVKEDGNKYNNGITEEQALELFRKDISEFENYVNDFAVKNSISFKQNEFDALVSFSYNAGLDWIQNEKTADLKNMLISGNYTKDKIKNEFFTWISIQDIDQYGSPYLHHSEGLYRRRNDEANIFNEAMYERTYTKMPVEYDNTR